MIKYLNLGHNSNVDSYVIGQNYIDVKFYNSNKVYRYSYISAGQTNVEFMKNLAIAGRGLNSFINKHAKYLYECCYMI